MRLHAGIEDLLQTVFGYINAQYAIAQYVGQTFLHFLNFQEVTGPVIFGLLPMIVRLSIALVGIVESDHLPEFHVRILILIVLDSLKLEQRRVVVSRRK